MLKSGTHIFAHAYILYRSFETRTVVVKDNLSGYKDRAFTKNSKYV